MIHHLSFGAENPSHAGAVLAELMGATAVQAPSPPFPFDSWLVCYGDENGSLIELLPRSFVFDPEAPLGIKRSESAPARSTAHVLVSSPLSSGEILDVAKREGWTAHEVETGLFKIVKVWVEDFFLVEFLTPEERRRYNAAFGTSGLPVLDGKLRELEASMSVALTQKLGSEKLASLLGRPENSPKKTAGLSPGGSVA